MFLTNAGKMTTHNATENVNWLESANRCQERGGRLATWDELKSIGYLQNFQHYWIGLYHHPWIWIHGKMKEEGGWSQIFSLQYFV